MNPLSSELPFHVHNWLIVSLKDVCIVTRKWPTFWPSRTFLMFYYVRSETFLRLMVIYNSNYLFCRLLFNYQISCYLRLITELGEAEKRRSR